MTATTERVIADTEYLGAVPEDEPKVINDAKYLETLGFGVFPCNPDKTPRVKWKNPPKGGWAFRKGDLIGVPVPDGAVVLDIDNNVAFEATGLIPTPTVSSRTKRAGGVHYFYQTDGRKVRQTQGGPLGYDTRSGGDGYVIAWNVNAWKPATQWGKAPEWLYEPPQAAYNGPHATEEYEVVPEGTRDGWLASLAGAMRARGLGEEDMYAALCTVAHKVPSKGDADFRRIAKSIGRYEPGSLGVEIQPGNSDEEPFWKEVVDRVPPRPKSKNLDGLFHSIARPIANDIWKTWNDAGAIDNPVEQLGARPLTDISMDPPPPLLIGRLDPEGHTILYGEGGVGKGTMTAWWIVQLVNAGHTVLILDYENHPGEWARRIHGLGGPAVTQYVHHVSPATAAWGGVRGALWDHQEDVKALADALGATYIVIDSIVGAVGGVDAGSGNTEAPAKYGAALTYIGRLCLSLAHVTRAVDLKYPFGSVYWHNFARFTWSLQWSENRQSTVLVNRKHNNYAKQGDTVVTVTFAGNIPRDVHEKARSTVMADLIWDALTEPMTAKEITQALNDENGPDGEAYKANSIERALKRGLEATAKTPQRFHYTAAGEKWSRREDE